MRFYKGFWTSGRGGKGMEVSHHFFVDNILCDSNKEHIEYLTWASCGLKQSQV